MVPVTEPRLIVALTPSCVWGGWAPPDIQHCEQNLCGWIAAPADSWSNLAYFAVAALIWRRSTETVGRAFAATIAAVGACSFALHASFTAAGQFLDYLGMFLYAMLILALNLRRLGVSDWKWAYWAGVVICSALVPAFWALRLGVQYIMALCAIAILAIEARIAVGPRRPDYRLLLWSLVLSAVAFGFWQLDFRRVLCDPENHWLQWHAAWHALSAFAMLPLVDFYRSEMRISSENREKILK